LHIIYIHQHFKTPADAGGTRSFFISKELIKNGHRVTMIAAKPEGQQEAVVKKQVEGIDVIYIRNPYSNKMGIIQRAKSFFRFMWKATRVLFRQNNVDLVIATSTPLTVGVPALLYKKIKGVPYVFEVRDLWPEVPIQMGALKNPLLRKTALMLEKMIYKNAAHIVALSPGMKEGVLRVLGNDDKVSMIPNMAKPDRFWRREPDPGLLKEFNLQEDSFMLIHFGAMGIANGLDYIVDAAKLVQQQSDADIEFLFLGDGAVVDSLKQRITKEKVENVTFIPKKPMDVTSAIVNLCDVSLVTFLNLPILCTNSPNKLFDSLSAGIPAVVNSNGWTRTMVEENHCGAYVNPENPTELAALIIRWKNNPAALDEMGKNARNLAETKYDKTILCKEFVQVVNSLAP
jgi:glycosyltransferase involved in cell wall biosynthesis